MAKREVKTVQSALSRTNSAVVTPVVGDGLTNVIAGLGTERDKASHSYYAAPVTLQRNELENMYRSSWLAGAIVDCIPDDMTREWRTFCFADKTDKRKDMLEKAEKKFTFRAAVKEALMWSRLYGGALIIIGNGDKDMTQPLVVEKVKKGDLKWLRVIDRHRVSPSSQLTTDLSSRNFGLPEHYIIAESAIRIHHTRIIRFTGRRIPYFCWMQNGMWDDSELQHVIDSIMNSDTTSKAIATMIFEANVDVIVSKGLAGKLVTKEGEERVIKRYRLASMMKSFNRTLLLDGEDSYDKKSNSFANLDKIWLQFQIEVCGASGIAMTRLFGQSAAGLNATGEGDLRNYYDRVKAEMDADLRPQLEYFDEIFVRSVLGDMPEDYTFEFKSLWQISDLEKATISKSNADRDKVYVELGVVPEHVVALQLKDNNTYPGMSTDDIDLVKELSEAANELALNPPPPPVVPTGKPAPEGSPKASGALPPVAGSAA